MVNHFIHSTLYHTILNFNNAKEKNLLKTLWEKEKMLVTSIFSFSRNVFYPSQKEFLCLSHIYLSSAKASNLDKSKILLFGKGNLDSLVHLKNRASIDLYPYDVTFVNKYQSHCILGSNGGNTLPYCCC